MVTAGRRQPVALAQSRAKVVTMTCAGPSAALLARSARLALEVGGQVPQSRFIHGPEIEDRADAAGGPARSGD